MFLQNISWLSMDYMASYPISNSSPLKHLKYTGRQMYTNPTVCSVLVRIWSSQIRLNYEEAIVESPYRKWEPRHSGSPWVIRRWLYSTVRDPEFECLYYIICCNKCVIQWRGWESRFTTESCQRLSFYGLCNDVICASNYGASNGRIISEWNGMHVEGSGLGLIRGTIPAFTSSEWGTPRKPSQDSRLRTEVWKWMGPLEHKRLLLTRLRRFCNTP
jgi:hypothetical protein